METYVRAALGDVLEECFAVDWFRENFYALAFQPLALQRIFLESHARHRFIMGGNQSGKTAAAAVDAALIAAGLKGLRYAGWPADGRPRDVWAVALDFPLAREKIIPALRQALGGHNMIRKWYERDQTFVLHNGARIIVKSCDSREAKFQSVQVDHIWFDEAPPQEIWKECQPRILARDGTMAVSMTPTKGMDWIHDRYYKPWEEKTNLLPVEADGSLFVMMDLLDNPYVPAHAAKEMIADLVDEDEVAMRRFGKFVQLKGRVFKNFDPRRNTCRPFDIPPSWPKFRGMDWGFGAPAACLWFAYDPGNRILYAFREFYERELTTAEIVKRIVTLSAGEVYEWSVLDPACWYRTGDKTETGVWNTRAKEYLDAGLGVMPGNNDVEAGIDRLRDLMGGPLKPARLMIFDSCPNFIREIIGLTYRKARKVVTPGQAEKLADVDDHLIDCARYVAMADPTGHSYDEGWKAGAGDGFGPEEGLDEPPRQIPTVRRVETGPGEHAYDVGWAPAPDDYDGFDH